MSLMFNSSNILSPWDGLVPAGVSLAILLTAACICPIWLPKTSGSWSGACAIGAGVLSVFKFIRGAWPSWMPQDATSWLVHIAIVATIAGFVDSLFKLPRWARLGWILALALMTFCLVLQGPVRVLETRGSTLAWIAVASLVAVLWAMAFQWPEEVHTRITTPLAMTVLAACAGALLLMSGSLVLGRLGLALAGAAAPAILVTALNSRFDFRGAVAPFVAVLGALTAIGRFYSDLTGVSLILLGMAPLLLFIGHNLNLGHIRRPLRVAISLTLLILPLIVAIALAAPEFVRSFRENGEAYVP